jgi:hypothetical protein
MTWSILFGGIFALYAPDNTKTRSPVDVVVIRAIILKLHVFDTTYSPFNSLLVHTYGGMGWGGVYVNVPNKRECLVA